MSNESVSPRMVDAKLLAESLGQDVVVIVTISPDGEIETASWGNQHATSQIAGMLADACLSEASRRFAGLLY